MRLTGLPCPNCQKKTMSHPDRPHAYGFKEYELVWCRKCGKRYRTDKYEAWIKECKKAKEAKALRYTYTNIEWIAKSQISIEMLEQTFDERERCAKELDAALEALDKA